ncbi:MAG: helix-turn-helix transcriptional regulator [Rikenellaceae bacterium]
MELFSIEEQITFANYLSESDRGFRIGTLPKGYVFRSAELKENANFLVFVVDGELQVECDNRRIIVSKGEFYFLPISSIFKSETLRKCKLVVFKFLYSALNINDRHMLSTYHNGVDTTNFAFRSFTTHKMLGQFLTLMQSQFQFNPKCEHLQSVKSEELFIILRMVYGPEVITDIFHEIMGEKSDFRAIVLDKYKEVNTRQELADVTGMSISSFSRKFKEEFGEPVYSWMLKQRSKEIHHMLAVPSVSVGDIVKEFGFSSPSHLTKYCRKQFGCTPTELRNRIRKSNKSVDNL